MESENDVNITLLNWERERLSLLLFNRELKQEWYFQNSEKLHFSQQRLAKEKWHRALLKYQQRGQTWTLAQKEATGLSELNTNCTSRGDPSSNFRRREIMACWPFCLSRTQNNIYCIIPRIDPKRWCLAMAVLMLEKTIRYKWQPRMSEGLSEHHFPAGC